ncbi:MAG: cytochrome P460 family protein [Sandaracinaceae bacterium]
MLSLTLALVGCGGAQSGGSEVAEAGFTPEYTADGAMVRPTGYRRWVYVGTPLTPNALNPPEAAFPEFHNVYVDPVSFRHFEETGEWRDGTVVIKELALVGQNEAVSGNGYFMGNFTGLEASVKSASRFPDEPGNWAYFSWGHSYPLAETAMPFETAACNSCHEASAETDFVFTQFYPVLRAANPNYRGETTAGATRGSEATAAAALPVETEVPTDNDELLEWLRARRYEEFAAQESTTHSGRGPHPEVGNPVRVFLSPALAASLEAGNEAHPAGAGAVKEMFNAQDELVGWAVEVKVQDDSAGGAGWFWYEVTSTEADAEPVASGTGVALCVGCHGPGRDYVLTSYPFD